VLRARDARDRRGAPPAFRARRDFLVPRCAIWASDSGDAAGRLLRLRRQLALSLPTARRSAATCSKARRGDHAGHRFRRVIAPNDHVRFAYTIDMAKLESGVARLAAILRGR
jgi:hypothetical protein